MSIQTTGYMSVQTTGYTRSLINVAHDYTDYRLHEVVDKRGT